MTPLPNSKSWSVADEIISDLRGRKGMGDEWDQVDDDIQEEIRESVALIIDRAYDDV